MPRRALTRPWGGVCLVGLAAAILSSCGGQSHVVATRASAGPAIPGATASSPIQLGKVVYTGNFSDPAQHWPTGSDANQSLLVDGSDFLVQRKTTGDVAPAPSFSGVPLADLVHVAVSSTVQLRKVGASDGVGVFCRSIKGHSYVFSVGSASQSGQLRWSIVRHNSNRTDVLLGTGTVGSPGQPFTVEGDCVGGQGRSPVLLALSVGGERVAQAADRQIAPPYFGLAGLSVSSAVGGTSATFSSFEVRAASAS